MSIQTEIIRGYGFDVNDVTLNNLLQFLKQHSSTIAKCTNWSTNLLRTMFEEIKKKQKNNLKETFQATQVKSMPKSFYEFTESPKAFRTDTDLYDGNMIPEYYLMNLACAVITEETDIWLEYCQAENEKNEINTILLVYSAPWEYNETEKNLTKEAFINIMQPYLTELGIKEQPEYKELRYDS